MFLLLSHKQGLYVFASMFPFKAHLQVVKTVQEAASPGKASGVCALESSSWLRNSPMPGTHTHRQKIASYICVWLYYKYMCIIQKCLVSIGLVHG